MCLYHMGHLASSKVLAVSFDFRFSFRLQFYFIIHLLVALYYPIADKLDEYIKIINRDIKR